MRRALWLFATAALATAAVAQELTSESVAASEAPLEPAADYSTGRIAYAAATAGALVLYMGGAAAMALYAVHCMPIQVPR